MRSQKATKKLNPIWLVIDLLLVAGILVTALYCVRTVIVKEPVDSGDLVAVLEALTEEQAQLETKIKTQQAALDQLLADTTHQQELDGLMQQITTLQGEVTQLNDQYTKDSQLLTDVYSPERMQQRIEDLRTEYGTAVRQLEDKILAGESDYRICYLTFDDGPSYQTGDFLNKLQELDAYATFFTIGCSIPNKANLHIRDEFLRREAREGHTIANHTYSHAFYGPLYKSVESFMQSVEEQDALVYQVTGMHTDIVRFPAGSQYTAYRDGSIQALLDAGYQWMDWVGNAFDSGDNNYTYNIIANAVINQSRQDKVTVILMHDWNVHTLAALDRIVTTLRAENYLFLPLFKESVMNGNSTPRWG